LKGSEWKEKAENLEVELQQCYKAQSLLSNQLVVEVAESRAAKTSLQEKEAAITDLQNEATQIRLSSLSCYLCFFYHVRKIDDFNVLGIVGLFRLVFFRQG
jgi:hypothetical protein